VLSTTVATNGIATVTTRVRLSRPTISGTKVTTTTTIAVKGITTELTVTIAAVTTTDGLSATSIGRRCTVSTALQESEVLGLTKHTRQHCWTEQSAFGHVLGQHIGEVPVATLVSTMDTHEAASQDLNGSVRVLVHHQSIQNLSQHLALVAVAQLLPSILRCLVAHPCLESILAHILDDAWCQGQKERMLACS